MKIPLLPRAVFSFTYRLRGVLQWEGRPLSAFVVGVKSFDAVPV
jgi:hypothetical protein